jgi:hypothetical protein
MDWKAFLADFRKIHGDQALPVLKTVWDDHYNKLAVSNKDRHPKNTLQIMDIVHELTRRCNQFTMFVDERSQFLTEVRQYLADRVSIECVKSWDSCMEEISALNLWYTECLCEFTHDVQKSLVREPLLKKGVRAQSDADLVHHLFSVRNEREDLRIDHREYRLLLKDLNGFREKYLGRWTAASERIKQSMDLHTESRQTRKIRSGFWVLRDTVIDPGRKKSLKSMSVDDFPLPEIAERKAKWKTLDDRSV